MRNRGRLAQEGSTAQAASGACATPLRSVVDTPATRGASKRPPTH